MFTVLPRRVLTCLVLVAIFLASTAVPAHAELRAGAARIDLTPPVGTPSAGYGDRRGRGMEGVHDPLLATSLVLDNGERRVALVGVDHLGFGAAMVQGVKNRVHADPASADVEVYLGSSHSHSAGGAYLNIPGLGAALAGEFNPDIYQSYIDKAADAVIEAAKRLETAELGVGYGHAPGLSGYRGDWPPNVDVQDTVAVIKVTKADGAPLAVLFNFAAHPTVLGGDNLQFSADYVGAARQHLVELLGGSVQPVFFNGAQGDVSPRAPEGPDDFARCDFMGQAIAEEVKRVWDSIETSATAKIETLQHPYDVQPKPTTSGFSRPGEGTQMSEINAIVFNDRDAFMTIPGEMSCIYDADIKRFGGWLGFNQVSVLGLTNDAHGYIITPESWRHRTYESSLSFGGELYGDRVKNIVYALLHALEPEGAYNAEKLVDSTVLAE